MTSDHRKTKAELIAELEDLRERLRAVAAPEPDSRIRDLLDRLPVMVDAMNDDRTIVFWNRECERVTGYSADEIVGRVDAWELLYPDADYRERMLQEWQRRGNDYYDWEWTLRAKDGSEKTIAWYNISGRVPVPGFSSLGLGVEVSRRVEAERRLAAVITTTKQQRHTAGAVNRFFAASADCQTTADVAHVCLSVVRDVTSCTHAVLAEVTSETYLDVLAEHSPNAATTDLDGTESGGRRYIERRGIVDTALSDGRRLIIDDPGASDLSDLLGTTECRAIMVVPVQRPDFTGLICIAQSEAGLHETDGRIVKALGAAFAIALNRARAEEARRRTLALYEGLAESAPIGITVFDAAGRCVSANPAAARMFDTNREVLQRANYHDLETWKSSGLYDAVLETVQSNEGREWIHQIETSTGHQAVFETRLVPLTVDNEQHLMVLFDDVSGLESTVIALEATERRLSTLLDNLPGMAYRCANDPSWTMEIVSSGCRTLTGYDPVDLIDNRRLSFADVIHPDDRDMVAAEVQREVERNRRFQLTYRIITADGSVKWVWEQGRLIAGRNGEDNALEGFITDITEQKAAEDAVRASEEKYRLLIESTEMLVMVHDREGTCLLMNRAAAHAHGGDPADFIGRSYVEVLGERGERMLRRIREVIDSQTAAAYEDEIELPVGRRVFLVNIHPVRDALGRVDAAQTIAQDVTDIRSLEEELAQAQKMEAVGRLAGGIAHDFNNLVTVILNTGKMLQATSGLPDEARRELDEIMTASSRAADLTRQLLTFSSRQIVRPRAVDLNEAVANAEKMLRRIIGEDINLVVDLEADLPSTMFDAGQAEQILLNLAVNARDAMPHGGRLRIATAALDVADDEPATDRPPDLAPGRYATLTVSDTGSGMSPEVLSHAFEPFFTTKATGEGTGLGLSTVYGIVRQHHGGVDIVSDEGRGTSVTIYLPAHDGDSRPAEQSDPARTPVGTETVLLIEDEAAVRRVARRILERLGYSVLEVESPTEGIRFVEDYPGRIDLVLSDVVMPEMNGRECVDRLVELRPGLRSLFMSGYTETAVARSGVLDTDTNFIQKPFTMQSLATAVRQALDTVEPAE